MATERPSSDRHRVELRGGGVANKHPSLGRVRDVTAISRLDRVPAVQETNVHRLDLGELGR